ncbi:hypothetical protein EVAR_48063_1 [Eumeta japonica]|uniref:Mos1 transposase HTH domain-containing protein n=1 Tax=Eumeta variegata TaxID=151549 RepID=A0A4C1XA22_EUMVA|nr:hypothetical protein EVAR_48063_1 [Eumeta japonica]
MIFYDFCCNLKQQESFNRLWLDYHDEVPSLAIVCNWFNEVKGGRTNLTDDMREGRPSTAKTTSHVRLTIRTDKRVPHQQIRTSIRTSGLIEYSDVLVSKDTMLKNNNNKN